MVLVDFGQKKWFSPILTEKKTGFSRLWPKDVILGHLGFLNEFFELENVFFCGFLKLIAGSTGPRPRDVQHGDRT